MKTEKYQEFELEDFLEDEYFRRWILQPDAEAEQFWEAFIEQYPEKKDLLLQARDLVQSIHGHFDDAVGKISREQAVKSFQNISGKLDRPGRVVPLRKKWFAGAVAASLVLCLSLAGLFFFGEADPAVLTYSTGNGQRLNILLPDSTQIELNANSVLSYSPENWANKKLREVDLVGEAYFHVARKPDGTRFIVHSGAVDVTVLGTSFNVRARGEDSEVVLEEGKIELSIADQKIAMAPGDFIAYSESQKKVESKKVNPSDYTSWKDGIVVFNKNLSEVAKELEILYGVTFSIENEAVKDRLIQLSAPSDSLEKVLEILEIMYSDDISIKLEEGLVRIY